MTRARKRTSRWHARIRHRVAGCVVACAVALVGVIILIGASLGVTDFLVAQPQGGDGSYLACDREGSTGIQTAYADNQTSSTSSTASPSPTSNKPEASPSPSGNAPQVDELESNTINGAQLPDSSFLYDTSIAALTSADSYFDNQIVQVTGEAVGDSIRAGLDKTQRWITLAPTEVDESETLAVCMTEDFAKLVDGFGKYGRTGTILQVRGTFHLACSEHDGVTDLHAENVSVVKVSESHPDALTLNSFIPGLVLVVLGVLALIGYGFARERLR